MSSNNDYLDSRINLFGHKTYQNDWESFPYYQQCIDILKQTSLNLYQKHEKNINIRNVRKNVILNSDILLRGVDLNVKYLNPYSFQRCCKFDSYYQRIEGKAKKKSVFMIPLSYSKDDDAGCCFNISSKHHDYPFTVVGIEIIKDYPEATYMHEITHALIDRNKGIVENYIHGEMMPILLEFLYAYYCYNQEDVNQILLRKLAFIKESLGLLLYQNASVAERNKYVVSSLLSLFAFDQYENASFSNRKAMLEQFKQVLMGEKVLENVLKELEISFSSSQVVDSLEKTIRRIN